MSLSLYNDNILFANGAYGLPIPEVKPLSIGYAVMAVPARLEYVREHILSRLPADTALVVDDPPSGKPWKSNVSALRAGWGMATDWVVVLEDDALLCNDFQLHVRRALATCPGDIANFYCSNQVRTEVAAKVGASWMASSTLTHGICHAVRYGCIQDLIAKAEDLVVPYWPAGDVRHLVWCLATGRQMYSSVQHLVQHRPSGVSLMEPGMPNKERQAANFKLDPHPWWTDKTYQVPDNPEQVIRMFERKGALRYRAKEVILRRNAAIKARAGVSH